MSTKTKTSKATLKKAAKLLQKSHDYIETFGFDINEYNPSHWDDKSQEDVERGPCCFIGSVRYSAKISPTPGRGDVGDVPADEGDGPELTVALEMLDKCAKKTKYGKEYRHSFNHVGRFVEAVGIDLDQKNMPKYRQNNYALSIFRKAITEIHKEIG